MHKKSKLKLTIVKCFLVVAQLNVKEKLRLNAKIVLKGEKSTKITKIRLRKNSL